MNIVELNQIEVSAVSGGFDLGCFVFTFLNKTVAVVLALGMIKMGSKLYKHEAVKVPTMKQTGQNLAASAMICGIVMVGNFIGGNAVALSQYYMG